MIDKLFHMAKDFSEKISIGKTELEQLLFKATSSENYMLPNEQIYDLADRTFNYSECSIIMNHLWARMKLPKEEWRKIFKSLYIMEIIVKVGDPSCLSSIQSNSYKLRTLQTFSYKDKGHDKGQGIREKAKSICDLLENKELLEEEKEKVKQLRAKLSGHSSGHSSGYGKYGGMSSSSYSNMSSSTYGRDISKAAGYSGADVLYGSKPPKVKEEVKKTKPEPPRKKAPKKVSPQETKAPAKVPKELFDLDLEGPPAQPSNTAWNTWNDPAQAQENDGFEEFVSVDVPPPQPTTVNPSWATSASVQPSWTNPTTVQPSWANPAPATSTFPPALTTFTPAVPNNNPLLEIGVQDEDDFDDFKEAAPPKKATSKEGKKAAKIPTKNNPTFADEASDIVDFGDLMKPDAVNFTKPKTGINPSMHQALYGFQQKCFTVSRYLLNI